MIVDDVKIKIEAGHGGKGAVAFNKNLMSLGPAGGSGGKGGDIYAQGVSDLSVLKQFRFKKKIVAANGRDGRPQFKDGEDALDEIINVPVGTVLHNITNGEDVEVTHIGEKVLLAKGGKGGKGNFLFRSSRNTSPKQFQSGEEGESFEFHCELKFIADVGLIGLPNVGKSSLLNELTNAKSKVANYEFTTLEPNLGVYYELIIADIPGLIEGASQGRGLGIKFLKHIERTKVLFHLISAQSMDPQKDYKVVRDELKKYKKELTQKDEFVFISKTDEVSGEVVEKIIKDFKKKKIEAIPLSVLDEGSVSNVKQILNKLIKTKTSN